MLISIGNRFSVESVPPNTSLKVKDVVTIISISLDDEPNASPYVAYRTKTLGSSSAVMSVDFLHWIKSGWLRRMPPRSPATVLDDLRPMNGCEEVVKHLLKQGTITENTLEDLWEEVQWCGPFRDLAGKPDLDDGTKDL